MKKITLLIIVITTIGNLSAQSKKNETQTLPISTQWTLSNQNTYNKDNAVLKVFMIINRYTGKKGTGFLIKSGHIITNHHVIENATFDKIALYSPDGNIYEIKEIISDPIRDLAILTPKNAMKDGFNLANEESINIGNSIYTWGYPLGYNGPAPLLSVGHLSGFTDIQTTKRIVKHIVVNGALNNGNSGGPLLDINGNVIGVVQSKHLPISDYLRSVLEALENNQNGLQFTSTDNVGNSKNLSESQLVAQMLNYYRELAQVMIGEAVTIDELKAFLKENKITGY